MMKWEVKSLGEVCDFVRGPFGGALKKSCFVESGFAVYEQKHAIHGDFNSFRYFIDIDKFEDMSRFEVAAGDVLMSCSGTIGRTKVVPEGAPKGIINQALLNLKPKEGLTPFFLKKWMESVGFVVQIEKRSSGAALQNVASVKILKTIEIPLPDIEEQQEIVALLDSAFEKIDKAKANVERNLKNAEELFQSALDEVFSNPGEDWELKSLGEVCQIRTGKVDVNSGNPDGKYAFFTCARLPTRSDVYAFDCEAILIAGNGEVGLSHYYRGKFQAYQRTYVLSGFEGLIGMYLKYAIDFKLIPHLMSRTQGTAIPYIRKGGLSSCPIICPPAVNQKEIVSRLDALSGHRDEVVAKCKKELIDLEEMRQSILEQAFDGKLTSTNSQ